MGFRLYVRVKPEKKLLKSPTSDRILTLRFDEEITDPKHAGKQCQDRTSSIPYTFRSKNNT